MNSTRCWLIAGAALVFCGVFAPAAKAQAGETIEVFTKADLVGALDAVDAKHEPNTDNATLNITFSNGLRANAAVMACEDQETLTNCHATSILATFGRPADADDVAVTKAINTYNYRENFGRAYVDPNGKISVRLYIISDGGIRRENYRRQINLWAASLGDFTQYLYSPEGS